MTELKNVTFSYEQSGSEGCLKNTDLAVNKGEFVLLTGESGCGKSTVLRLINGLIPHYYKGELSGEVTVNGISVPDSPLCDMAKYTGTVFQNPRSQFFNVDTTSELAFGCENMGMAETEIISRIEKTAELFSVHKLMNRSIFNLSGGEKQKIACASVDVMGTEIILLDEPSANLDTEAIADLRHLIKIWKEQRKTILIAEHRISYIWDMIDRAVIMRAGQIVRTLDRTDIDAMTADDVRELGLRTTVMENPCDIRLSAKASESIIIRDLHFGYDKKKPVVDIQEMNIPMGEVTAIVGRNGAGKTTFLQCLCGLKKCKGTMIYRGKSYNRRGRLRQIFMVMQDVNHQLFTESVLDEVLISMPQADESKAGEILSSLGLAELAERHPMSLSGGQKQRVAVACAIASEREILLFDEPTSGLDCKHMKMTAELIHRLREMGRTVIIVTHDSELIRECCTNIIRIGE